MISRRRLIRAGGAGTIAMSARKAAAAPARASTFLLVHGTGLGGWCWRKVAENLRAEGHVVFTPTLTGVGERAHLVSPAIGLDTHIDDVAAVAECEELERFIIVGHSYAGTVITGVCDRMRERIAHAVYIDAAATKNGQGNSRGRTLAQLSEVFGGGHHLHGGDAC
jgi:pimeloyl-ACP methyl ester carboxylesterase